MKNLATIRKQRGLTQVELGEMVGKDQSHISRIEKSLLDPGATLALAISKALDTTVEELFGNGQQEDTTNA